MPIYEYRCEDCGTVFEKLARTSGTPLEVECPNCGSRNCQKAFSLFGMLGSSLARGAGSSCAPSG